MVLQYLCDCDTLPRYFVTSKFSTQNHSISYIFSISSGQEKSMLPLRNIG
jgi:hypothetical protein